MKIKAIVSAFTFLILVSCSTKNPELLYAPLLNLQCNILDSFILKFTPGIDYYIYDYKNNDQEILIYIGSFPDDMTHVPIKGKENGKIGKKHVKWIIYDNKERFGYNYTRRVIIKFNAGKKYLTKSLDFWIFSNSYEKVQRIQKELENLKIIIKGIYTPADYTDYYDNNDKEDPSETSGTELEKNK